MNRDTLISLRETVREIDVAAEVAARRGSFAAKVQQKGPVDCWPWAGSTKTPGSRSLPYGRFYISKSKVVAAHRAAWILAYGDIPDGRVVCHRCDNPKCCNPGHLFLGTVADNNADRQAKGRSAAPSSGWNEKRRPRCEAHGCAKLSADDVHAIRVDGRLLREIAAQYGVNETTISRIRRGTAWTALIERRE